MKLRIKRPTIGLSKNSKGWRLKKMLCKTYQKEELGILRSFEPNVQVVNKAYGMATQKEYDLTSINRYELASQVESRARFHKVVNYMRQIYCVEGYRQDILKHTYILEAYNKQDLLIGAHYIMTKLISYGFSRGEKIIDITMECVETPLVKQLEQLLENKVVPEESHELSLNWELDNEAVCVFIDSPKKVILDLKHLVNIKQRPLFILVQQNGEVYQKDVNLIEELFPSKLERLKVGAIVLEIAPLSTESIKGCLERYFKFQDIKLDPGVDLRRLAQDIPRQGLGEEDIKQIADTILSRYLITHEKDEVLSEKSIEEALKCYGPCVKYKVADKINELVGLDVYKQQIDNMICQMKFNKMREEQGLKPIKSGMNAAFLGPPGTAKTTMGRLFAALLKEEGILQEDAFVECRKSDLIGKYVGWTSEKVDQLFESLGTKGGGVILFDEIYSLTEEDSTAFDTEALNCIVQNMEIYRNVICIFAGYENKMQIFLEKNPGLRSRIAFTFYFNSYTLEELNQIFKYQAAKAEIILPKGYKPLTQSYFKKRKEIRGDQFGNGREARNLLEIAVIQMSSRIIKSGIKNKKQLMKLEISDLEQAISLLLDEEVSSCKKKLIGFNR